MIPISIEKSIDIIAKNYKPRSIFLYGSQARGDTTFESDYEIGVIFDKEQYVGRSILKDSINNKQISIYPFKYEQFITGDIDTPFQKKIYMYELCKSANTLRGEQIIEKIKPFPITAIDLMEDLKFNLGYALASVIAHKNNSKDVAQVLFYKSALFTARNLIMIKNGVFSSTYHEIKDCALKLNLDSDYLNIITHAYDVRYKKISYDENLLFKNISFINQVVESEIRHILESKGYNTIIIS